MGVSQQLDYLSGAALLWHYGVTALGGHLLRHLRTLLIKYGCRTL